MIRAWMALGLLPWAALAQQPKFVLIPAGPAQQSPFSMARTETTVEQFTAFVRATGYRTDAEQAAAPRTWHAPGFPLKAKQPVVYVTPADAMAYCQFIGARLPSDAEWEYAARAGATTRHYWGGSIDGRYLWYRANSDGARHPVARKQPNAFGLYDIEGNVWEWALSPPDKGDPLANRRGGSWIDCEDIEGGPGRGPGPLIGLSTSFKISVEYGLRYDDIGFRCARSKP
jgi:formylglycine-generating enzyme required for sulfatase activity